MAVAVVNSTSAGGSGASVSINVPTGTVNGNVMLLVVSAEGSITVPAAWTLINLGVSPNFAVYTRIASSEPASYTLNTSVNGIVAVITSFSGAARVTTEQASATTSVSNTNSFGSPTIPISFPGAMLVNVFYVVSTTAITLPGGLSQQGSNPNDGIGLSLTVGTAATSATTTASSSFTATTGSNVSWRTFVIAIQPGVAFLSADTTNNGRILSQIAPKATGLWQAYVVPTGASALVNSIVADCTNGTDSIYVSVGVSGAGDNAKQYLYSALPLQVGTTFVLTTGITLQAGDVIRIKSSNLTTAFTIFGQEITSGDSGKVLGQSFPSASTLTTLYTVPGSGINWSSCSTVLVCNQSSITDYFRMSVQVAGATDDLSQYLYYDIPIDGKDTFEATIGIPLSLTDVVKVRSLNGTCSFNLFGSEVQAA